MGGSEGGGFRVLAMFAAERESFALKKGDRERGKGPERRRGILLVVFDSKHLYISGILASFPYAVWV